MDQIITRNQRFFERCFDSFADRKVPFEHSDELAGCFLFFVIQN